MESFHAPSHPDEETRLRHERAWAAGFFDGEGWAAAPQRPRRRTRQPYAQINQSSTTGVAEVLVRFREAVGGIGGIRGPVIKQGRVPLYRWTASSRGGVGRVYELLRPWLSGPKLAEFHDALAAVPGWSGASSPADQISAETEGLAWAAGLFDGEGWASLTKHRSHTGFFALEAGVTQSSSEGIPEVLRRFQRIVGVGNISGPIAQKDSSKPVYRWKTHGVGNVEPVIQVLWPWLSGPKREQARLALEVMRAQPRLPRGNPAWGAYKTHCVNGHEYATARIRPYKSRHGGTRRRDSKQCLACAREQARAKQAAQRGERGI